MNAITLASPFWSSHAASSGFFQRARTLLGLSCLLLATARLQAANPNDFLIYNYDFKSDGTTDLPGRLFVPLNYNPAQAYPLVIFFHGAGEVGTNNTNQVGGNIDNLLNAAKTRGFFLYAPQAASSWNASSVEWAMRMAGNALRDYSIDPEQVSVTGLSMGGGGAWDAIIAYHGGLAAGVPICGQPSSGSSPGSTSFLPIVGKPIWAYHARDDGSVGASYTRNRVNAVRTAGGLSALTFPLSSGAPYYTDGSTYHAENELRYSEYLTGGHGIWGRAYNESAMYDWLFAQTNPITDTSLQPGEEMYFDFGGTRVTAPDSTGRVWNSTSSYYHSTVSSMLVFAKTSTGIGTPVILDVKQAFGAATTTGNTALYETNIGTDGWQTTSGGTGKLLLRGLIPAATYRLECYGATTTAGRFTRYEVGALSADLNATGNTTSNAVLNPVPADAAGQIELSVTAKPGSGSSYGQISTLKLTVVSLPVTNPPFFTQDFSSSSTVSTYASATPNSGQFNDLSAEADAGTWSINAGRLQIVRTGVSSVNNGAGFTRYTATGPSEVAEYRFKLSVNNVNTTSDLATFDVGKMSLFADYNNTTSSPVVSNRLTLKGNGAGSFRFTINGTSLGSFSANGTDIPISWFMNHTAAATTYNGPDGNPHTLNAGCCDLWANAALLFNNATRPGTFGTPKIDAFRFRIPSAQAITLTFDDLQVFDVLP